MKNPLTSFTNQQHLLRAHIVGDWKVHFNSFEIEKFSVCNPL